MTPLDIKQPVVEETPVEVEVEEEEEKEPKTNGDKWLCALYVTILFLVVSMPATYKLTNALLKSVCVLASKNGCPTICGIVVHALVFLLLLRLGYEFMPLREGKKNKLKNKLKNKYRKIENKLKTQQSIINSAIDDFNDAIGNPKMNLKKKINKANDAMDTVNDAMDNIPDISELI